MDIEFSRVGKRFVRPDGKGEYDAVTDINLHIEAHEILCLLGPSGCGKSTLLHMAAGFELPSVGRIRVAGKEIRRPGPDRGVVFQSQEALFGWLTVRQNVEYGPRVRGVDRAQRAGVVEECLQLVGLAAHADKFPRELSGGMKQRVQIARMLANDPAVLLMDEPFGALDAQTRATLQDELQVIWEKSRKTILFVTHDVAEAVLLGDRIAVMTAGPGARISMVLEDRLPRPRDAVTPGFVDLHDKVRRQLETVSATLEEVGA